jgi:site-specific DNA-methyltransferase (adenine-specific)
MNRIIHGDCTEVLKTVPAESVDFVLTDPPYFVRYRDRSGRSVQNDGRTGSQPPSPAGKPAALIRPH